MKRLQIDCRASWFQKLEGAYDHVLTSTITSVHQ